MDSRHSLEARAFYLAFALSLARVHTCGDDESPARVAFCKTRPDAPPGGTCWADVCEYQLRGRWVWAARESLLLNRPHGGSQRRAGCAKALGLALMRG
jgi:hypothetical protein